MGIKPWKDPRSSGRKPLRREAATNGDSRMFMCHDVSGLNVAMKTRSPAHWMKAYSGGAITFPASMNNGVGGDNTKQVMDRQAPIKALPADTLVLNLMSTNDRTTVGMDADSTRRNMIEICRSQINSGQVPLFIAETPRGPDDKSLTGQALQDHVDTRRMILTELRDMGARIADPWAELLDLSSGPLYLPKPGMFHDKLHWSAIGAEVAGRHCWAAVKDLFAPYPLLPKTNSVFSQSMNPTGSRVANPLLLGTGAAVAASVNPVAGSVMPPNYKVAGSNMTGIQTQISKRQRAIGESVVFTFTGQATVDAAYMSFEPIAALDLTGVVVGSKLNAVCGVSLLGNPSGLLSAGLELKVTAGSTFYYRDGDQYRASDGEWASGVPLPGRDIYDLTRETPTLTFDASITAINERFTIYFKQGVPLNCSVEIFQMQPQQVVL